MFLGNYYNVLKKLSFTDVNEVKWILDGHQSLYEILGSEKSHLSSAYTFKGGWNPTIIFYRILLMTFLPASELCGHLEFIKP